MVDRGKGTILFTGCSASLNGIAGYSELCKIFKFSPIASLKFEKIYISLFCLFLQAAGNSP